ncbi:hypothetical protein E5288_WYG020478 [Bos mutus]|uniref:Uncharacterized protein n=1 Tax=Bos mutus TaxID=72004 RepID=A0A6B0S790_9CETA|nr:hypothetical protein [Bos mutus]
MRSEEVQILRSVCELVTGLLLGDEAEAVLKDLPNDWFCSLLNLSQKISWLCITYIYESVNFEAEMFGPEEEEFFQGVGKASSRHCESSTQWQRVGCFSVSLGGLGDGCLDGPFLRVDGAAGELWPFRLSLSEIRTRKDKHEKIMSVDKEGNDDHSD